MARNPCRNTGAGQARSDERPLLDLEQVQQLAATMPVHLRGLLELAFWGHLRLGELVALPIEDVDLDAGRVSVRRQVVETDTGPEESAPKAGSQRTVYLPELGVDALDEQLPVRGSTVPTDRLFARPAGHAARASRPRGLEHGT